ncbi:hypothetical protein [Janibacter limosus]|uniref:hypothetical protein n=1 Tax=Janibacter limosus TaxID=53458 RepID=UPI0008349668|nr:hypothetical protein [Janibacter limosus]
MALHDPGTIEEGDPAMIRAEADELKTVAANIHTVAEMLRTVSTKGVWDSCAGTTFDNEVGATPDDLVEIANRLAGTERIIRPYADRLETSQTTLERIRIRYDENVATAERCTTKLATMTPEDPEYLTVDREYRAASNSREMNKRGYQREAEEARADEQAMAARLALVAIELSDPRAYNGFEKSSSVGTSSLVNNPIVQTTPWGKPVQVVAVADPVGKLGRRMFYDEGSYKDVSVTTVLAAVDFVIPSSGKVKEKNFFRTSRHAERLKGIRAADTSTNPIARTRIVTNAKNSTRHQVAKAKVRAADKVTDTLATKSGARLVDDFATDWAAVAGSGRVRKGGVAIKYSIKATNHTVSQVSSTKEQVDRLGRATESGPDKQARQEREQAAERRQASAQQQRDAAVDELTTRPVAGAIP